MALQMRHGLFEADKKLFLKEQEEHKNIQKLMDEREKEYEDRFDEIVRESANFVYPENYASKVVEAVQNPVTGSYSLDMDGDYIGRGLYFNESLESQKNDTLNLRYQRMSPFKKTPR